MYMENDPVSTEPEGSTPQMANLQLNTTLIHLLYIYLLFS
jgi:hypothetical protein